MKQYERNKREHNRNIMRFYKKKRAKWRDKNMNEKQKENRKGTREIKSRYMLRLLQKKEIDEKEIDNKKVKKVVTKQNRL